MVTHQMPGTSRYDNTIAPFVEDIKKASGGRLIIEPYGANNLFPTDETFDSIKNGVVEMGAVYSGLWTGKDPVFGLAGGIAGDPIEGFSEHFYRSEELEPILSEAYEKHGIKNLGSFDFAPSEILISTVPIKTIEDFKGKNIRAAGVANLYYGKLGASSVSLSAPEIYTALQLGTVDAAEYNDYLVNQEMGLEEVTKYIIDPAMHVGPLSDKELIVNPEAWEELPNDLKEIVIAARDKIRYRSAVAYTVENFKAKDDWIANGVEIIELPKEDVDKMRDIAFDLLLELREKSPTSEEYVDKY
ncbi:MAG TPA: TRAP transporter substrate-binding protein DctP, partial [Chitinophagaceae bacterium]|nr:TRAP transporter substrate-binding protein DctP [Chitinophagaceae bacterium]